ncbi:MAG: bifunctional methylenetetrahydrofolate dehydrogenase/methenyltetrahydrofolate cyclohydrolase [Parvibaculum sp.]|uniref:bifunctional methylenetetrahydrofolate dehydrogenase/methenyltetrahydrofolate cyclohydrolase n=1 Tax=Parvibaculum sp. TaxID=2024848 RepID=UPI001DC64F5E|nr:bifunctional methylenetetrahydrofolate dehydrogenase/methenyltetrahydrofolate cyclohydrolase [Parvibaculum sp.]MBX3489635.1 bifunctional methylenetetrahydrofolate dehydrogenase/methenyltetrahydrofolate cyclohydrolase [Parvibaculum sp.]MBX3494687.1 bifunctional methylenetetrahydrofolate dehydrogenase/methenyltetrahydrofolate cyclohydrolase [Parvibaculum sp.]MCW5726407.1 bifunctional methylenetetrahydrofolate dehydrogenase/methenyltetrahydrofolate cyclohydrolase [Parvibaculum sp.]
MSEARIIDGKKIAEGLRVRVAAEVARLKKDHGLTPGLAVVLVGNDPASEIYVRNKGLQTKEAGMNSFEFKLPETTTQEALLAKVRELNADPAVHGILVQFPVPAQISQQAVIETIDPDKDVDGLHPVSAGRLASGLPGLVPATPTGCLVLAREAFKARGETLAGKHAVVVGRSNLVGKPVAQLLLGENCTVTIAHSRTADLPAVCRLGDILVAATGRAEMIRGNWVKPGAVVIDVGTTRIPAPERGEGKMRLVGDVAFAEAKAVAGDITPVPGGVGPMTIACLLRNTLFAAARIHGIAPPQDI